MNTQQAPKRLRWKLDPQETGLRRIMAGPRSSTLRDENGIRYATVSALGRRWHAPWYWVAGWGSGVPHMNTCDSPVATVVEAKAAALAYVRAAIAQRKDDRKVPA
jgi:hypothetical protein